MVTSPLPMNGRGMDAVSPAVDRINIDSIKIDYAMTRRDVGLMNKPDERSQSNALTKGSHVTGTAVPPAGPGLTVTPGLKGVVVAETEISDVLGDVGVYHYRGLPATDLARLHTFEAVWSWVWDGQLSGPIADELTASALRLRSIPDGLGSIIGTLGRHGDATAAMRSALSAAAGQRGTRSLLDADAAERRADALALCAMAPCLVAAIGRVRRGDTDAAPVRVDPDLGYAGSYLHMLTGTRPSAEKARALDQYLISTIDHGFNASTFTARVIASTGSDMGSAMIGALGALAGPLHGGAPSRCLEALDRVGVPNRAPKFVKSELDAGRRLMGFGHAVYRTEDPRSALLKEIAIRLGGPRSEAALALEEAALAELARRYPERPLMTNVEFWASVVLEACDVPPALFTATFAMSRMVGWAAHIDEQIRTGVMYRPSARFVGATDPHGVAI